jgi:5'-deoxynucleotidase YfbR-like HD superfamily hydrolase
VCLVHDLAESIVGDITPHDNVTSSEKRILEEVSKEILISINSKNQI